MNNNRDKRSSRRHACDFSFDLSLGSECYSGKVSNISLGGIYAKTIQPELIDSCLAKNGNLTLHLNPGTLMTECQIVYASCGQMPCPAGVGLVFVNPDVELFIGAVEEYIERISE